MLHIYRGSHSLGRDLQRCLYQMSSSDALLLIEDGVYLSQNPIEPLKKRAQQGQVFILVDDVVARGLSVDAVYQRADMAKWVSLSVEHDKSLTW
ncbi:sulfurtransferase complex subunit TusB [Celerinatantimonas diazotrophica]|uniref:Sulfur relay protein TusB/DsrH n=1 Tax=Celerinatantimonas diazotrophica TaxID=412034 RepID=A0A4V2PR72_9GAMM|nr:sulfurtransferase complex subunit TusB [Celerinatantimonas diazotrophica]TCK57671.1 sulfur relay protein TusB/DsrH [Celerinatantimonas diazotrophica]CAG9298267.1 Protein TusB [Celerinatantimonas diazotrophica]